ncbi:O-antigen ligase family protein [Plectonema cf. radiosum LEGE 06105]|uniref:O-antigen ligase family protein n=1 Tax=Plectonema cf. radiosum LEGE 06105 TaxID=945769 RepID=A0A8J7JU53_9CYAN|nr:O-antigen ligase family protein [Plectonema radiosum]MBE9214634.1 O-antigen ligase family protein [Plectonema cf. radiosum LEGE 06105]
MLTNKQFNNSSYLSFLVGLAGVGIGAAVGFGAGAIPVVVGLLLGVVAVLIFFFARFEQAVLTLLVLRSSLDPFSAQQVPAAFAIGLDGLTILYVIVKILIRQKVHTDKFFWVFAGWVGFLGIWVILPIVGWGLLGKTYLIDGIREWTRIFSWLMIYLLVMQLKGKIHPQKVIPVLFFSLLVPLTVGFLQLVIPSRLPDVISCRNCLNSTIGHPSTFGTFLFLFISLTLWKLGHAKENRWFWLILLGTLAFFMVMTKSLTSLIMMSVFIIALIAPKLNFLRLVGGILFIVLTFYLFASTEFGYEKLNALLETPLFNQDLDISRTILLSFGDGNSANWRIAQWSFLIDAWKQSPLLGYGLGTSQYITYFQNYAHNDYLRFLAETGIIGFTSFIVFLGIQIVFLGKYLRDSLLGSPRRRLCVTMIAIFAAILLGMATDNVWNHTTLFFYWWLLFAIVGWEEIVDS